MNLRMVGRWTWMCLKKHQCWKRKIDKNETNQKIISSCILNGCAIFLPNGLDNGRMNWFCFQWRILFSPPQLEVSECCSPTEKKHLNISLPLIIAYYFCLLLDGSSFQFFFSFVWTKTMGWGGGYFFSNAKNTKCRSIVIELNTA